MEAMPSKSLGLGPLFSLALGSLYISLLSPSSLPSSSLSDALPAPRVCLKTHFRIVGVPSLGDYSNPSRQAGPLPLEVVFLVWCGFALFLAVAREGGTRLSRE